MKLTSTINIHHILHALILLLAGCSHYPSKVQDAIEQSKDNRVELEMAIDHYKAEGDSLKLAALFFLLGQLPNYVSLNYGLIDSHGEEVPVSEWPYTNEKEASADLRKKGLYFELRNVTKDIETISKEYIISNIELAFEVWLNYPWCKDLTFDEFCHGILPHKINGDPMNSWRSYFYDKHKTELDSLKAIKARREDVVFWLNEHYKKRWVKSAAIIPSSYLSYEEMEIIGGGTCDQLAKNAVQLMRACGIPLNLDLIPFHGKINGGHSYNSLYSSDNELIFFSPYDRDPQRREWRAPRVLRQLFEFQPNSLLEQTNYTDLPPGVLGNPFLKDVTNEYFPTENVILDVKKDGNVFLCTYNGGEFHGIIWGRARRAKVKFQNLTKDLLYFPMYYESGQFTPAANPFVLREDGKVFEINGEKANAFYGLSVKVLTLSKNITLPNRSYTLHQWDGEVWKEINRETGTGDSVLNIRKLQGNGLYLVTGSTRSEQIQRPFTCIDGRIEYW